MNPQISNRKIYLDLFKYFLAFLVISIHTIERPFDGLNRLGVIMFFMITGYFMYSDNENRRLKKAKQFILRSFIYMLIGFLIYFLYDMIKIALNELTFASYVSIYTNPRTYIDFFAYSASPRYAHLWYLISLFFISIYHYLFVKFKITSAYKWVVIAILVLVAILYYGICPRSEHFRLVYLRNSYLMGLPAFATGFVLNKEKAVFKHPNYFNLIFGTIFFLLQITEAKIMSKEFYYCSFVSSIFFILYFTNLECKHHLAEKWYYQWIGKNATFYIYILHILVRDRLDLWRYIDIPIIKPLLVLVISFMIYEVGFLLIKFIMYIFSKSNTDKKENQTIINDGSNELI